MMRGIQVVLDLAFLEEEFNKVSRTSPLLENMLRQPLRSVVSKQ